LGEEKDKNLYPLLENCKEKVLRKRENQEEKKIKA